MNNINEKTPFVPTNPWYKRYISSFWDYYDYFKNMKNEYYERKENERVEKMFGKPEFMEDIPDIR